MARARAFGTIRKLPSGRYQARYWHLGKQIAAADTFAANADARAWLAAVETDIRRGERIDPRAASLKFGPYASTWMDNRPVRPRTLETYESQLKHILPRFERADLGEITPHDVRVWHGQLMRSGMNRNTAAKVYRLFRTIMGTAVDDGLLRSNPVAIKGAASERIVERPSASRCDDPRSRHIGWLAVDCASIAAVDISIALGGTDEEGNDEWIVPYSWQEPRVVSRKLSKDAIEDLQALQFVRHRVITGDVESPVEISMGANPPDRVLKIGAATAVNLELTSLTAGEFRGEIGRLSDCAATIAERVNASAEPSARATPRGVDRRCAKS